MDRQVSVEEFLRIYSEALSKHWNDMNNDDVEKYGIYGQDFTIHWNGIYCNVGDGATPANHIIPAIRACLEEL